MLVAGSLEPNAADVPSKAAPNQCSPFGDKREWVEDRVLGAERVRERPGSAIFIFLCSRPALTLDQETRTHLGAGARVASDAVR
jgi:hypothetical protein